MRPGIHVKSGIFWISLSANYLFVKFPFRKSVKILNLEYRIGRIGTHPWLWRCSSTQDKAGQNCTIECIGGWWCPGCTLGPFDWAAHQDVTCAKNNNNNNNKTSTLEFFDFEDTASLCIPGTRLVVNSQVCTCITFS